MKLKLSDQAYCILRALLNSPGELVTREQLIEAVWPERTFVDFDSAINKSISRIRTVLGDDGAPRFIETLSRRATGSLRRSRAEWRRSPRNAVHRRASV